MSKRSRERADRVRAGGVPLSPASEPLATQLLEEHVYPEPRHRWRKKGMGKKQLQKVQDFYKSRYGDHE